MGIALIISAPTNSRILFWPTRISSVNLMSECIFYLLRYSRVNSTCIYIPWWAWSCSGAASTVQGHILWCRWNCFFRTSRENCFRLSSSLWRLLFWRLWLNGIDAFEALSLCEMSITLSFTWCLDRANTTSLSDVDIFTTI